MKMKAKDKAKRNLTKSKNPDWDNLDRGYRYLTQDMKLDHNSAIALLGNVLQESLGDYKKELKGGNGKGLILWDGRPTPKSRYGLWGSIWASVAKPANVYDKLTDTLKNYWAPYNGLKGDLVRKKFLNNKTPIKEKVKIYSLSYLRPGKPELDKRTLFASLLDSIYNPAIKDILVKKEGGTIKKFQYGGPGYFLKTSSDYNNDIAYNISNYIMKKLRGFYNSKYSSNYDLEDEPLTEESSESTALATYLLPRELLEKYFLKLGYFKGSLDDYGLVRKEVGNRNLPVYLKFKDTITRDRLTPISMYYASDLFHKPNLNVYLNDNKKLTHAGDYPIAIYLDESGNIFYKAWDLNDYGGKGGSTATTIGSKVLDKVGSPVVVTTGFLPLLYNGIQLNSLNYKLKLSEYKQGGKMNIIEFLKKGDGIYIKPSKRGSFTRWCGGNVTEECIRKGKNSSSPAIRKKATFASNARKWKHLNGGLLEMLLYGGNVDTRSDTTRKGYHEGTVPWGAVDASNTGGLFDLLNYNITSNPNVITGEPTILPGKMNTGVLIIEKEAPTLFKMINEFPNTVKNFLKGDLRNHFINFFKTKNKQSLLILENKAKALEKGIESTNFEAYPKGFVKGNEITPVQTRNISEEGLSIRTQQPFTPSNYTANPAEKAAAKDFKELYPDSRYKLETQLKTGRPSGDYMYPEEIQQKYKIGKYKPTTKKVKPEKAKSKTAKVTLSERYLDRKNYSKTLRLKDKYARNMEYGDNRITNAGNSRFSKIHRENKLRLMREVYPYKSLVEALEKKMVKYDKNSFGYKQARKKLDDLIDDFNNKFGYKKDGGTLLFLLEGGKTNFWQKVGRFLNSDTGKLISNIGTGIMLTSTLNKQIASNADIAKSGLNMEYSSLLKEANKEATQEALLVLGAMDYLYLTGQSPDNSARSSIFQMSLKNKLLNPKINQLKQELLNKKSAIDAQSKSLMNLNWGNTIENIALSGLSLLASKGNNTNNSSTTMENYTPYSYME